MAKVTPDHIQHKRLVQQIIAKADALGLEYIKIGCEDIVARSDLALLWGDDSGASQRLRHLPDLLLKRPNTPLSLFADAKTHGPSLAPNMAIEAWPLMDARLSARLQAPTMFIYEDIDRNIRGAFWGHNAPPFSSFKIPCNGDKDRWAFLRTAFSWFYPRVPIQHTALTQGGSNDPFVVVKQEDLVPPLFFEWESKLEAIAGAKSIDDLPEAFIT